METLKNHAVHGGALRYLKHDSATTGTPMTLSVFTPPGEGPFPVLIWLSGLTCTEDNFTTKAGAYAAAAEHGVIIVAPDTSPRGDGVADDDAYDLGQGAGFYVDATEAPFAANYRMYTYVVDELPWLIAANFPADMARQSIFGHSMGGHGALTIALRNPERFRSCSAFAPIVHPSTADWSSKAFERYLGPNEADWRAYDACLLIEDGCRFDAFLVDQGKADGFLRDGLRPWLLEEACRKAGIPLTLRMQDGYDHSYYFISSFMEDHLRWHASRLVAGEDDAG